MEELRKCPFCGGKARQSYAGAKHIIICPNCVKLPAGGGYIDSKDAVTAWNTRPDSWISVKNRLPEVEKTVLIMQTFSETAPYANITIGHLHQNSDLRRKPYWSWIAQGADMVHPKIESYHRAEFICPGNEFVTHWMPLPEPPKGDEN